MSPSPGPPASSPALTLAVAMVACGVAQGFGRFTWALVLPALDRTLLHSYSLAGLLGTANVGAYLAGTIGVSLVATRHPPERLMCTGLALSATGLALLAVAPGLPALLLGMVLTGFAGALIWIPAPGLAGAIVGEGRRGFAIGVMGAGIGAGIVFASELAAVVHRVSGEDAWRQIWVVEAAIAVATLAAAFRWLRPARPLETAPRPFRISVLRDVPGWKGITAAYAAYGLGYSLYMSYVVAALEEDAGFSAAHASAVYALVGVAVVFGGMLLGRLSDRIGRRPTLVWGFVVKAGCAALVLVGAEPWAVVSAVLFGLVMSGLGSVVAAYVADHLDPRSFGTAFGVVTSAFGVAQLLGPQLGGWLADSTGSFTAAFVVSSAAALAGAACSATLPRRRSG
jgi:predicted MFS family arabinose efflux permease